MRIGITIAHQQQIVAAMRRILRTQKWAAIACLLLVIAGWTVPLHRATPLAVAMIQAAPGSGGGAGFLVTPQLLLTSANVIGSQQDVLVSFRNQAAIQAHVVFADRQHDVALLELQSAATLPPLPLTDSNIVADRDEVKIAGYPGGDYADNQHATLSRRSPELLTTDMPPLPGNSGGPLMHTDGTVIGLVESTAEFGGGQPSGTHVALPINLVKKLCREQGHPID